MAKRFVDTGLGRQQWFRVLSPLYKCAFRFLLEECDCAGAWAIDMDSMAFHIGERVELQSFLKALNSDKERIRLLPGAKLFVLDFVRFQYGELSEGCKPHQRVIERLKELTLWPFDPKGTGYPLQRVQEEEEEKDKEEEEEKEGGVGETNAPDLRTETRQAAEVWLETLAHFRMGRENLVAHEDSQLARAIQAKTFRPVVAALIGARFQEKGGGFNPAQFLSLSYVLGPKNFDRLLNLGVQALRDEKAVAPWTTAQEVAS